MFKKLLNVGKGHLSDKQQQQQLQHKDLFQLNEIRSYGFSHLTCLGYSPTLSLLAVGSKLGLLRVLGNPSVEFSHQLDSGHAIRQIEFIDCRTASSNTSTPTKRTPVLQSTTLVNDPSVVNTINGAVNDNNDQQLSDQTQQQQETQQQTPATAKIICLTDDGQLHLLELKTVKQIILNSLELTDNTTQTTNNNNTNTATAATAADDSCCQQEQQLHTSYKNTCVAPEYTKLDKVATFDLFVANNNQHATIKVASTIQEEDQTAEQSQEQLQQQQEEQKSRKVTTIEISLDAQIVYVGTEGGSVYQVPLEKFSSYQQANNKLDAAEQEQQPSNKLDYAEEQYVLAYDDIVAIALPDDMKAKKASPVESIKHHQTDPAKILVGYQRGLTVLLDINKKKLDKFFYHNQVLESLCWSSDPSSEQFYTSHNDGSYVRWDMRAGNNQTQANNDFIGQLYGPYPCKPTSKIQSCKSMLGEQQEDLIIFSGGLPRARYDGKNPVTIVKTDSSGKDTIKTVLDFTSKVLDFIVITKPKIGAKSGKKNKSNQGRNHVAVALAVLAEEEFVVIDLLHSKSDQYLEHALPYLNCVHSSAITCNQHYSDISDSLYEQICQYNQQEKSGKYSPNEWPITGGKIIDMGQENKLHDLLLTGHEDGSVHFWDVSGLAMKHLLQLTTSKYFGLEDELIPIDNDEQQDQQNTNAANDSASRDDQAWPPFKRVGQFDPYSDDARLAVRKFSLCPKTGCIVVVGTAGQVLVFNLKDEEVEKSVEVHDIQLITEKDGQFVWKGQAKLDARTGNVKFQPGYHLTSFIQLNPPASVTAVDCRPDWGLVAAGTSHGFVLFDYIQQKSLVVKCTLNGQDFAIVNGEDGVISRRKSFKKSLRESFRRLRKGRSQRVTGTIGPVSKATTGPIRNGPPQSTVGFRRQFGANQKQISEAFEQRQPVERQVEARTELNSIVRCLNLTSAVITQNSVFTPTLWVGNNAGLVLVYEIILPTNAALRQTEPVTTQLAKEIQLKHKAPVIAIFTTPTEPEPENSSNVTDELAESSLEPTETSATDAEAKPVTESGETQPETEAQATDDEKVSGAAPVAADVTTTTSGSVPASPTKSSPNMLDKSDKEHFVQPRVLICSEEQFKVFNLPNLKPSHKFKLTAHEGLRARKIHLTQFVRPSLQTVSQQQQAGSGGQQKVSSKQVQSLATQTSASPTPTPQQELNGGNNLTNGAAAQDATTNGILPNNNNNNATNNNNNNTIKSSHSFAKDILTATFGGSGDKQQSHGVTDNNNAVQQIVEPYMVCMSNQGDCAVYSVPDLKRQAQIQVCKREDVNGITSTILTNYGEGFYLQSTSDFLRFSISTQRVLKCLSVV